jgi:hypothetical protein
MKPFKRKMLRIYRKKVIKIPKWVKRITITFKNVTELPTLKFGNTGIETTGYNNPE